MLLMVPLGIYFMAWFYLRKCILNRRRKEEEEKKDIEEEKKKKKKRINLSLHMKVLTELKI